MINIDPKVIEELGIKYCKKYKEAEGCDICPLNNHMCISDKGYFHMTSSHNFVEFMNELDYMINEINKGD